MTSAPLDGLLSEDVDARRACERGAFQRLSQGRPLVLLGAGGLGRLVHRGLRQHGVEPLAFADNAPDRQGTVLDGVPVLAPHDAARLYGRRAAFVVTIWGANRPHRFAHSREQLQALGCDVVCSFAPLLWAYPDTFLPYYLQDLPSRVLAAKADVRRAFDLWADDASRSEYVAQVGLRLNAAFDGLPHPVAHPQYFPEDLFERRDDEWIVDGGAYDGDTIRSVSKLYGDRFARLLALEPDPSNFERLRAEVDAWPGSGRAKLECRQLALASEATTLYLDATGTAASATSADRTEGTVAVCAQPLDAMLDGAIPTFLKLDIEGAEPDALRGAQATIVRHAPVLAICVYHRQDHLWSIPLMLKAWRDDYVFFLRPHNEEGWDLVCYAIPRGRLRCHRR